MNDGVVGGCSSMPMHVLVCHIQPPQPFLLNVSLWLPKDASCQATFGNLEASQGSLATMNGHQPKLRVVGLD